MAAKRQRYYNNYTVGEEAYRVLRTNIQHLDRQGGLKIITVTSFRPGEGKSTVSFNLAKAMALAGKKTAYVDADLRKPALAKHTGCYSSKGLTNFISGNEPLDAIINETGTGSLYCIGCGPIPPNPAEVIASPGFGDFIGAARKQFDFVIIDTPPMENMIDCAVIASQSDGAIITVELNETRYKDVQLIKEQFSKVGVRILGIVLNKVDLKKYEDRFRHLHSFMNFDRTYDAWRKRLKESKKEAL